jgi:hypothetical protein
MTPQERENAMHARLRMIPLSITAFSAILEQIAFIEQMSMYAKHTSELFHKALIHMALSNGLIASNLMRWRKIGVLIIEEFPFQPTVMSQDATTQV